MGSSAIAWRWYALADLTPSQAYAVFAAREAVFIVEQACAYQDLDGHDERALHLVGWWGEVVATYLRILPPGTRFSELSIGRLLSAHGFRRSGSARCAMVMALEKARELYPAQPIRISAQRYLEDFYASLGFKPISDVYLEGGIAHVDMLLKDERSTSLATQC